MDHNPPASAPGLKRKLRWYHIFMITIGGIIGIGFATTSGQVLAIAGPGGTLIAFGVNGFVAICVMEGICEMIVLWPVSNAMIEFVRAFVDKDLAIVVGIAYWYSWACTMTALVIGAAGLLSYWNISTGLLNVVFFGCIVVLFLINCSGILLFGRIELAGGIFKLLLVTIIFLTMICVNNGAGGGPSIGSTFFNDGIKNNPNVAGSQFLAVIIAIPIATFSYTGVEIVTVTAFEAARPKELRMPAKNIAYFTLIFYVLNIGGFIANIEWFNQNLPQFFSQPLVSLQAPYLGHTPWFPQTGLRSSAAPIIATLQVGMKTLPAVLTGLLMYSGLSAANASLYVASRTLYGLTRDLAYDDERFLVRMAAKLNVISPGKRVPLWSLLVSVLAFSSWLPFIKIHSGYTQADLQNTFESIGSTGCLLVWASQCLAFIRYNKWLWMHKEELQGEYLQQFQRWPQEGFSSWASALQPGPAYVGLISCLVIVFILNTASLWNGQDQKSKALTVFLGPGLLLTIFLVLKLVNKRKWVILDDRWEVLHSTLSDLTDLINPDIQIQPGGSNPPTPSTNNIVVGSPVTNGTVT